MKLRQNLKQIKTRLQQNHDAFKKNKQNFNIINFPTLIKDNQQLNKTRLILQYNLSTLQDTRSNAINSYQIVIKNLNLIIESIMIKNQFLIKDRADILKQNYLLKQQIQKITSNYQQLTSNYQQLNQYIIQIKMHGNSTQVNGLLQNGNIFQYFHIEPQTDVNQRDHYSINYNSNQKASVVQDSNKKSSQSQQSMLIASKSSMCKMQSPSIISQNQSDTNLTPTLNYPNDEFCIQKTNKHYAQISSKYISYQNSQKSQQLLQSENKVQEFNQKNINYPNNEVQISLSNINNINPKLYLPINGNKPLLSQQIDTFKRCLHNQLNKKSQNKCQEQNSQNNVLQQSDLKQETMTYISCSSECNQGIFRSFYLSILQYPLLRQRFFIILSQFIHDNNVCLFKLYPQNQMWIDMITNFLKYIQNTKQSANQLLHHINTHKLLDILIIQVLKSRVQFLFNQEMNNQQGMNSSLMSKQKNNGMMSFNGSVNMSLQNIQQINPHLVTQRKTKSQQLQYFNALGTQLDLICRIEQNHIMFFSQDQLNSSTCEQNQIEPIFQIINVEERKMFVFSFDMIYQQSQNTTDRYDAEGQRNAYQMSVNKQFQDIQLGQKEKYQQFNHQSFSQSSSDQHNSSQSNNQSQASFKSQTRLNESQSSDLVQNLKYTVSQNISLKYNSLQNTQILGSLRLSGDYQQSQNNSKFDKCKEPRQRRHDYKNINYEPQFYEDICQSEKKNYVSNKKTTQHTGKQNIRK